MHRRPAPPAPASPIRRKFAISFASSSVSRTPPRLQSLAELTSRELDALALLAKGKTYSQIAQELKVSYKTVVNISWQLKKKLDVDKLPALVQKAMRLLRPTRGHRSQ